MRKKEMREEERMVPFFPGIDKSIPKWFKEDTVDVGPIKIYGVDKEVFCEPLLKKICKDKNAEEAASTVELLCNIEMFLKNIKIDGGKILGIDVHPSGIGISVKYKIGKNEELGTEMNKETEVKRIAEALKLFNANGMRILFGNDKIVEATLEGGKQVNREVVEEIAKLYGVKLTDYKSI